MIATHHTFSATVQWLGRDDPDRPRRQFSRAHVVSAPGVPDIAGSAAKVFHGDPDRWNPEQMLLGAVAQCHMMTFLFLAHRAGLEVATYESRVEGTIEMDADGVGGAFARITLYPHVTIRSGDETGSDTDIDNLHASVEAHCFIARSLAVPIQVEATTQFVA